MSEKIKDGNIVVYKSGFSRSFIKDKNLYDQYKGVPYVVKQLDNEVYHLFWKGHGCKTIFKEGDKTLTYLGSDTNFKLIGHIDMPRKKYREDSGYDLIKTVEDFNKAQEIFNGNIEFGLENSKRHLNDNKGGKTRNLK